MRAAAERSALVGAVGASALALVPAGLKARPDSGFAGAASGARARATGAASAVPTFSAVAPEVPPENAVTLPPAREVARVGPPSAAGRAVAPRASAPAA